MDKHKSKVVCLKNKILTPDWLVYNNNISNSTSSNFGGDLILDDHVDESTSLYFNNKVNNYARLQFSTSDELVLKIGTSVKLTIGGTESSFEGKLAVNGSSVFADAELDVLGDITLINRNWALRGNNSNADLVIEKVVGNNFNDNNIALAVSSQKFVGIGTNVQEYDAVSKSGSDFIVPFLINVQNTKNQGGGYSYWKKKINSAYGSAEFGFQDLSLIHI